MDSVLKCEFLSSCLHGTFFCILGKSSGGCDLGNGGKRGQLSRELSPESPEVWIRIYRKKKIVFRKSEATDQKYWGQRSCHEQKWPLTYFCELLKFEWTSSCVPFAHTSYTDTQLSLHTPGTHASLLTAHRCPKG